MKPTRILCLTVLSIFCLLAPACAGSEDPALNTQVAVIVAQTRAAMTLGPAAPAQVTQPVVLTVTPAVASPTPEEYGLISGSAYLQGPPTPPLVIYALDSATGNWVSIETAQSDGETAFSLKLKPGSYQVFAFPGGIAYSLDGNSLSTVTVAAGQTVSGIEVRPPTQSKCGSAFGIPAAPDGRFAAIAGATPECLAGLEAAYQPLDTEECTALKDAISQNMGIPGVVTSPVEFEDYRNDTSGSGCQIAFSADGLTVPDAGFINLAAPVLTSQGWQEDQAYAAAGPGGLASAYRKEAVLCLMVYSSGPTDQSLCSSDEPFVVCWERLTPEQKQFSYVLNCAEPISP